MPSLATRLATIEAEAARLRQQAATDARDVAARLNRWANSIVIAHSPALPDGAAEAVLRDVHRHAEMVRAAEAQIELIYRIARDIGQELP